MRRLQKIPTLDLKFVVHHGLIAKQKMAGRDELVGRDVILIHRLLKNSAGARVGGHAYALYTDACMKAMGVDPVAQGFLAHNETIDIIGEVKVWIKDLHAAWASEEERQRVVVAPEDAVGVISCDLAAPPAMVWEIVTQPGRRKIWVHADDIVEKAPKGRRGAGTTNHCLHGKDTVIEEVLDWRPPVYLTSRFQMPMPGAPKFLMCNVFTPLAEGRTHLEMRIAPDNAGDRAALGQMFPMMEPTLRENAATLVRLLDEEMARRAALPVDEEPPLPVSSARFASAPVQANA